METVKDYEQANERAQKLFASLGIETTVSGPMGDVRDEWPCIMYNVTFSRNGKNLVVQYRLGVGHVNWRAKTPLLHGLTNDQESALRVIQRNPGAILKDKALWASTAAVLARIQKVTVKPYEVFACVCHDGSDAHNQSFADYCDGYGMNADSIKDKAIYETCCEQYHAVAALTNRAVIEKLADLHRQF